MRAVLLAFVLLLPALAPAATDVRGALSGETVWTRSGSPYVLHGDVTVSWGAKLTLEPGVRVMATTDDAQGSGLDPQRVELIVDGTLLVRGTAALPVEFTAQGAEGAWYGIRVRGGRGTVIDGATLTHASQGILLGMSATVRNTVVEAQAEDCLRVTWGKASLQGNDVSGCGQRVRPSPSREPRLTEAPPAPVLLPAPVASPPRPTVTRPAIERVVLQPAPMPAPAPVPVTVPAVRPSPGESSPVRFATDSSPPSRPQPMRLGGPAAVGPPASEKCTIEPQVNEPPECPGVRRWRKDQARLGEAAPGSALPPSPGPRPLALLDTGPPLEEPPRAPG